MFKFLKKLFSSKGSGVSYSGSDSSNSNFIYDTSSGEATGTKNFSGEAGDFGGGSSDGSWDSADSGSDSGGDSGGGD